MKLMNEVDMETLIQQATDQNKERGFELRRIVKKIKALYPGSLNPYNPRDHGGNHTAICYGDEDGQSQWVQVNVGNKSVQFYLTSQDLDDEDAEPEQDVKLVPHGAVFDSDLVKHFGRVMSVHPSN